MYQSPSFPQQNTHINTPIMQNMPLQTDFDPNLRTTHPSEKIYVPENIIIIDSRQRDLTKYPSPSEYTVNLGDMYKNITEIELKGSVIPKTAYNIHNSNNKIDFNIGSTITSIIINKPGYGYSISPTVTIAAPYGPNPVQATATASITDGTLTSIFITNAGSGYYSGNPPQIYISPPPGSSISPVVEAIVGTRYLATLRPGQYTIGGNPTAMTSKAGSGLIKEIQDSMNYAVNGGAYVSGSISPFQVRLVSQYPTLNPTVNSPEANTTNACLFNRIQITNVENSGTEFWELLFATGAHAKMSMSSVMGFPSVNTVNPVATVAVTDVTDAGMSLRAAYDYNLQDDPKYVILTITSGNTDASFKFDRQNCANHSIDKTFASLVFDANSPNVIIDTSGTVNGDGYLVGPVTKGPFWYPSGILKPVRGFDYDQKILQLANANGRIERLTIKFTQFSPEGYPTELYDFCNQNHQLIFSVKATDNQSGKKWGT